LYFDLQPRVGGNVTVGLYTDNRCSEQYTGDEVTTETVLNSYYGYDVDAAVGIEQWNTALDDFKVCQPCRTYDLSYKPVYNKDD
jgi:hypothetical protein